MDLFINSNGREERMDHPRFIFIFGWGLSYGVYLQRFLLLYIRFGVYIFYLYIRKIGMNLSVNGKKIVGTPKINEVLALQIQKKNIAQKSPVVVKPKTGVPVKKIQQKKPVLKPEIKIQKPLKEQKIQTPLITPKKEDPPAKIQQAPKVEVQQQKQEIISEVLIRYNHYKQKFNVKNGILSFLPIEEKYSFGDVFKGNFTPIIKVFKTQEQIIPETHGRAVQFSWKVQENGEYRLQITQDEIQQSKYQKKTYKAPKNEDLCINKKNRRIEELTNEMKEMDNSEYGGSKHRDLLEQRDLQDVLFG